MAYTTVQDTRGRVRNKLDLPNKPGWKASAQTTGTLTATQDGTTVSSPYYSDGRQVPSAVTYSVQES